MFLATSGLRFKKVQVDSVGLQGLSGLHFSGLHGPTGDPEWITDFYYGLGHLLGLGTWAAATNKLKKREKKLPYENL